MSELLYCRDALYKIGCGSSKKQRCMRFPLKLLFLFITAYWLSVAVANMYILAEETFADMREITHGKNIDTWFTL